MVEVQGLHPCVLPGTLVPKVNTLKKPILIVDCFAGRGEFKDGQPGSPLIIAPIIQKWRQHGMPVRGLFIEADPDNYQHLVEALRNTGSSQKSDLARSTSTCPKSHGRQVRIRFFSMSIHTTSED